MVSPSIEGIIIFLWVIVTAVTLFLWIFHKNLNSHANYGQLELLICFTNIITPLFLKIYLSHFYLHLQFFKSQPLLLKIDSENFGIMNLYCEVVHIWDSANLLRLTRTSFPLFRSLLGTALVTWRHWSYRSGLHLPPKTFFVIDFIRCSSLPDLFWVSFQISCTILLLVHWGSFRKKSVFTIILILLYPWLEPL